MNPLIGVMPIMMSPNLEVTQTTLSDFPFLLSAYFDFEIIEIEVCYDQASYFIRVRELM